MLLSSRDSSITCATRIACLQYKILNATGELLPIRLSEKGTEILPLHTQVSRFFLEKYGERCCKHILEISLHQIPLKERKKDLDRRLEKRASA